MDKKPKSDIRPPIVTLMGHVDHGKTTLLDTIRKTNIVGGEHGGITQHIGAYQIIFQESPITFIDTPGHAAFEKMRSRGAEAADIVILVVAATEGIKPQTQEAIKHIKKADRPIIVALTKMDLPTANPQKVKIQLQKEDVIPEELGGNVPIVEVSAPKNKGIEELMEMIQLVWQISPKPYLPQDPLEAVVVESFLDKNRGPIVTAIVMKGVLKTNQKLTVDGETITVRALIDDRGKNISEAGPAKPVEILGFKKILDVGSLVHDINVIKSEIHQTPATLGEIITKSQIAKDKFKIVVKADTLGSLEAILSNLPDKILVVFSGIGPVSSTDISLAKVASAPILAFNVKLSSPVKNQAEREGIVVKNYNVIYNLISDMEEVIEGFQQAKHQAKIMGRAKIVASFMIEGQKIAGAVITEGKIKIGDQIILVSKQNGNQQESKIVSLKKFKKDVQAVSKGQECGIGLNPALDFEVNDILESLG